MAGLGQLLFLLNLADLFPENFPRDALASILLRFIDEVWQNPKDDPQHLRQLADTTFAIRRLRYPYGWRDRGTQKNHHTYDVVRLLRRTWPLMLPEQRARATEPAPDLIRGRIRQRQSRRPFCVGIAGRFGSNSMAAMHRNA